MSNSDPIPPRSRATESQGPGKAGLSRPGRQTTNPTGGLICTSGPTASVLHPTLVNPPERPSRLVPKVGRSLDDPEPGPTWPSPEATPRFSPHTSGQLPPRQPPSEETGKGRLAGCARRLEDIPASQLGRALGLKPRPHPHVAPLAAWPRYFCCGWGSRTVGWVQCAG